MISDLIVGLTAVLTLAFVVAWAWRPDLRAWIERPKHQFQDALREYDRSGWLQDQRNKRHST